MPNKQPKHKFLSATIFSIKKGPGQEEAMASEYFIRYEGRGTGTDAIQGIVLKAVSAEQAIEKLEEELDYFKLLNIRKL